jgi:hypothetical protein
MLPFLCYLKLSCCIQHQGNEHLPLPSKFLVHLLVCQHLPVHNCQLIACFNATILLTPNTSQVPCCSITLTPACLSSS